MPFWKKKKKTTTETETTTETLQRIVKLSYLQTLAINGGLGDVGRLAGETDPSEGEVNTRTDKKDKISQFLDKYGGVISAMVSGPIGLILNPLAKAWESLFGKKVTRDVSVEIAETGWSIEKQWLQPEFDIIRYAIGIRELQVSQFTYVPVSEIVSQPWGSPKEVQKVSLIVDQFIPRQFPPAGAWIEYYVKPDSEDAEWVRINPLDHRTEYTDDGRIIPRIINFNTERSVNSRLEESFVVTDNPVRNVRFRAILKRPEFLENSDVPAAGFSPVLRSYRMLLFPRGGL